MTTITSLDLAWERINSIGGAATNEIEKAINNTVSAALMVIEELGGSDPAPKRAAARAVEKLAIGVGLA